MIRVYCVNLYSERTTSGLWQAIVNLFNRGFSRWRLFMNLWISSYTYFYSGQVVKCLYLYEMFVFDIASVIALRLPVTLSEDIPVAYNEIIPSVSLITQIFDYIKWHWLLHKERQNLVPLIAPNLLLAAATNPHRPGMP